MSPFFLSFFQIREIAVLRHNFEQRNWVEKQLRNEFIEYLRRHTDRHTKKKYPRKNTRLENESCM